MALTVKKPEGGNFELPPFGTHIARCYMVVDEGMQSTKFGSKHMIRIGWELPNELMADGRPFAISQEYNASLHPDSNLTKDLVAWRGRAFTDEESAGFDLFKINGAPCMVTIIHNVSGDRTYANVSAVTAIPKGTTVPEPINDKVSFSLDSPDDIAFQKIPEWIRKKINYGSAVEPSAPASSASSPDFDDDILF